MGKGDMLPDADDRKQRNNMSVFSARNELDRYDSVVIDSSIIEQVLYRNFKGKQV